MSPLWRTLATVCALFVALASAHADGLEQTHQTVPSANSSFITDLQNFLKREDAARHADLYPSSVVSGGTHDTDAGLTGTPDALIAYVGGYYVTEDASITYPDDSTCWVIAHKTLTSNHGSFVRVSNSHYLINCASTAQPTLPDAESVYLMGVTTSAGAITAVTDLRPFGGEVGFNLCRYASLEAALTALGQRPAHLVLNCALPVETNTSIPVTASLFPTRSGYFVVASDVTITLVAPDQLPASVRWRIFRGASTAPVTFTNPGTINPEWWGFGRATDAADNTTFLNRAIDSQPTNASTTIVSLLAGTYEHDNSILTNSRNICLVGAGGLTGATTLELTTIANARHGFKTTGTTQFQCVIGVGFITSTALTVDNVQTAIRMDGDATGDAPNLTAGAEQYLQDIRVVGYNSGTYADGGSTFKIARRTLRDAYLSVGGSGLSSGVNEGEQCQRVTFCYGDNVRVDGNDVMDHAVYDLTTLSSYRRAYTIAGSVNEAIKLVQTDGVTGLTDPRHWTFTDSVVRGNGSATDNLILVTADQDYTIDKVDLSNLRISNCGAGGSHEACVMISVVGTGVIRNLDLHGLTIDGAEKAVVNFSMGDTAELHFINATDLWVRDWSQTTDDNYSVFSPNVGGSAVLGTLVYSGYFDGATHGRSVFVPGGRDEFTLVQALAVHELNTAVPEPHSLVTKLGTSASEVATLGGTISCQTENITTDANTTETTLGTYTLQAGALDSDVSGATNTSGIRVSAWGTTAANANTKTIRLYIGGDVVKSNSVTTAPNGAAYWIEAEYHRFTTNAQTVIARMEVGATSQGITRSSPTHNLASTLEVKVTGQNGTSSDNDIHLSGFCIYGLPS